MNTVRRIYCLMKCCLAFSAAFLVMFVTRFYIRSSSETGLISFANSKKSAERAQTMEGIFRSLEGKQITWPVDTGTDGLLDETEAESFAFLLGNDSYASLRTYLRDYLYQPDHTGCGPEVNLTVSSILQNYAYEHILAGREGSVIVLDNRSGRILCLASHSDESLPPFSLADEENRFLSESSEVPGSQYIRGIYEKDAPGSVFKIVTAAAALENKDVSTEVFTFYDTGEYIPSGSTYAVHNYNFNAYGMLNLQDAFIYSANTYFANLAVCAGWNSLEKTAEAFGLNKSFTIPFLATVRSVFSRGGRTPAELSMTGFGQGRIALTPMNLALIGTAVANEGIAYSPYLVESIAHPGRHLLYENEPHVLIDNDISARTYGVLKECLRQTALSYGLPEGTYAKTGTAQCARENGEGERIHTYILVFTDTYSFVISMNDSEISHELIEPAQSLIEEINYVYQQISAEK